DSETARAAILAGAEFVVAPTLNLDVIRLCHRYDKAVLPGAFTPTEILTAWEAGADIVKVFPADVVGPAFFKALRGPLPQIRVMPTGGVDLTTAADFLNAGACCLGVGGQLVDPKAGVSRRTDNPLGRLIANRAREAGVDTRHVAFTKEDRVGLYFLEFGAAPRASSVLYDRKDAAISRVQPGTFDWAKIFAGVRW